MRLKAVDTTEPSLGRRRLLGGLAVAAGGATVGYGVGSAGRDDAVARARFHGDELLGRHGAHGRWYRLKLIGQPVMDSQVMFLLGLAATGLTDVGEVLDTALRIDAGDERSWFERWGETALRVEGYGDAALAAGHERSAASHFRRAGAYYRAGLLRFADHRDPRLVATARRALSLHDRALRLLGEDTREVAIPYEGDRPLHGRVHYAPRVERGPVLVLHQGLHAWTEDTQWVIDGALARGYHVLAFHGPGQGASLRLHGHPFRPDWEVPVGRVLDFAATDPRLSHGPHILMGLSFGGALAPRAAAFEPRVSVLVANPGVLSWGDAMLRHFASLPGVLELHEAGPRAFDGAIRAISRIHPDARWYFDDASWKHGVATPHELIDELRRYDNRAIVDRIRCPTLIMEGDAEDATPGESARLFEALRGPKHLMRFDASTASQLHCQGGNQLLAQAWLFDWLDRQVAR